MNEQRADPVRIAEPVEAIAFSVQIIAAARRVIWIRSLDLDPWLFNHPQVLDAL